MKAIEFHRDLLMALITSDAKPDDADRTHAALLSRHISAATVHRQYMVTGVHVNNHGDLVIDLEHVDS